MAYDEVLAERVRDALIGQAGVTEKRMFGGLAFLVSGKMAVVDTVCFQYRRHRESDSSVRALDGRRFAEERAFFDECVGDFAAKGWNAAARAARWHLTSRLNAVSLTPKVVSKGMWPGLRKLATHAVRP